MKFVDIALGPLPILCFGAVTAGLLSHWTYFIRGEHHMETPVLFVALFLIPILIFISYSVFTDLNIWMSLLRTMAVTISYLASLTASIVLYRTYFHRLRRFPGPEWAKISKLWHVSHLTSGLNNFRLLEGLHKQYGDFVRTGPSEITIFDPEAVPLILGPKSKCMKATWYDASLPLISMHTARDKRAHDQRRRIWDHGFSANALRNYEGRILTYAKSLLRQLRANAGQTVNATNWFHFFAFDVMGEIAFGKSFGMTERGKEHFALDLLRQGMEPVGTIGPIPWVFQILARIPGLASGYKSFLKWTADQSEERRLMKGQTDAPDVMSRLVDAFEKSPNQEQERHWLHGDSRLIIVAGSDTTAATLTYGFYHLARKPGIVKKLREEVAPLIQDQNEFNAKDAQNAQLLNGVINESLRLHPPVPSGVLRLTPPEGIYVGGTFIPGDTTVVAPSYSMGRLESCFVNADEFIPERWGSHPELIKNKAGFAPFSLGAYSCVGKNLALMELRTVIALIVNEFDVALAPGEDGTDLLENSRDFFTIALGKLKLVFTPRPQ